MASQLGIDQVGLPEGVAGRSRTDGVPTGAVVTLTNTGSGATTAFRLLWVPPGDISALSTLAPSGDSKIWTFEPTPEKYGSYLIELIEDEGLASEVRERRVIAVRTPGRGLVIPALNERGDPRASLVYSGTEQIEAADNNAEDYADPDLALLPYAAWWRTVHELSMVLDSTGSGGGGEARPFTNIFFVDKRNPSALPNGSIGAPFPSLQAAINAIPVISDLDDPELQGGVLLIAGHDYSTEALTLSGPVSFVALGRTRENAGGVVTVGSVDCQGAAVEFRGVRVVGAVTAAQTIDASDSWFMGGLQGVYVRCRGSEILSAVDATELRVRECALDAMITSPYSEVIGCLLGRGTTFTGDVSIDHLSYTTGAASYLGVVSVMDRAGTLSAHAAIEVSVPAILEGENAFVDVSVVGTALEGVSVPGFVLVNPTDDTTSEMLVNARVSGADTVRLYLRGPVTAGPASFLFVRGYGAA